MTKPRNKRRKQPPQASSSSAPSRIELVDTKQKPNKKNSFNGNQNLETHLFPLPFPKDTPFPKSSFLRDEEPYRKSFQVALDTAYEGFVVDAPTDLLQQQTTTTNHDAIEASLSAMHRDGYFRTDVTQPFGLGTKCAKTYVTRCLLGDDGTTYKYLGLRMFAHPWRNNEKTTITTDNNFSSRNSGRSSSKKRKRTDRQSLAHQPLPIPDAVATMYALNQELTKRTTKHLSDLDTKRRQRGATKTIRGRAGFDIALINRMIPSNDLKAEPSMGEGKCAVSWHADSTLEHYSSIAVYHVLQEEATTEGSKKATTDSSKVSSSRSSDGPRQWSVGLRVAHNSEGPLASRRGTDIESSIVTETPPLAVTLPSRSTYYMLDDFNHHHQHAVVSTGAGTTPASNRATSKTVRYSSTHRLLRESHNVHFLLERCKSTCGNFHKKGPKIWRSEQFLLDELESEWLRQFYIQGQAHYDKLWPYWGHHIQQCWTYWSQLESRTKQVMDLLRNGAEGKHAAAPATNANASSSLSTKRAERKLWERRKKAHMTLDDLIHRSRKDQTGDAARTILFDAFAELLEGRAAMRECWWKREKDHVFREMDVSCRPIPLPINIQQDVERNPSGEAFLAKTPLPMEPTALREVAGRIRACGKYWESGEPTDLPARIAEPVSSNAAAPSPPVRSSSSSSELPSTKYCDMSWPGWALPGSSFGLEMQAPWAGLLLSGEKTIETRSYNIPPALVGRRIEILQSPKGQDAVSSLGDTIAIGNDVICVGYVVFGSAIEYKSRATFERDEKKHLVKRSSKYAWKAGSTRQLFGWVVKEKGIYKSESTSANNHNANLPVMRTGKRRFRSLFQIASAEEDTVKQLQGTSTTQSSSQTNKKIDRRKKTSKKRKRF